MNPQRGFWRIGIVLAAPFLAASIAVAGWAAIRYFEPKAWWAIDPIAAQSPAAKKSSGLFDDLIPTDHPSHQFQRLSDQELLKMYYELKAKKSKELWELYWLGLAFVAIGAFLFIASVSLGWIFAGFAKE